MKTPLSPNELEILDRQLAMLSNQIAEVAGLLESRLGATNEVAGAAREIRENLGKLAHRIHRQAAIAVAAGAGEDKTRTA